MTLTQSSTPTNKERKQHLPIFIKTLTSAAHCFACQTFALGRHNADGNLMVGLCLLSCYQVGTVKTYFIIREEGT